MTTMFFKRYFLLLTSVILLISTAKAQSFSIGAKGGIISTDLIGDSQTSSKGGAYFGLIVNKKLYKIYSIQTEINYASQRLYTDDLQLLPEFAYQKFNLSTASTYYASYKKESIISNIQIPLLARVDLPLFKHFKYNILIGPYLDILTNAKNITLGTSKIYSDISQQTIVKFGDGDNNNEVSFTNSWSDVNNLTQLNMGVEGGAGVSYVSAFRLINIFIEGRFTIKLSNATKSSQNKDWRIIAIGFLYRL